ncbi:hypothetical protein RRG08_015442 [Elysia crispata]|uniref:Uncharacterized protein n=1 Tax=Elysia crispata TaxID=231223 RepID=A0AAE1CYL1_9GAST|nr:hypothetical protein RRG08_015442 [Elysia crispata]
MWVFPARSRINLCRLSPASRTTRLAPGNERRTCCPVRAHNPLINTTRPATQTKRLIFMEQKTARPEVEVFLHILVTVRFGALLRWYNL